MVSIGQITGLAMAIALPVLAGAVFFFLFWKRSSKIENGLAGAVGYGVLGYFWQEILYSFLSLFLIARLAGVVNTMGGNAILIAAVESLLRSLFVVVGLYWGVYLTNTKQRSLYRSAAVGIGFGIGSALLSYGFQLYYAVRINLGNFTGAGEAKERILATGAGTLYVAAYRNILMVIIFMGIALLMGNYHLAKKQKQAWGVPLILYVFLRFTDVILHTYLSDAVSTGIMCILLTALAAGSFLLVKKWLQTGKING